MTDDPNVEPKPASAPEPNELADGEGATRGGENAEDLDATQLEAAAEGAEDEVSDEEAEEAEDDTVVLAPGIEAAPIGAPGAPRYEPDVRGPRVRGPKTSRTAFAIDPALRIRDRASAAFVILCVAVFAAIIANALLFGVGGAFRPILTPSPIPQASEAPSASPSTSPGASASPVPSTAPSGSPAGSTTPSAAPSVGPTTGPSPT